MHSCLQNPERSLDESFGPVRAWVYTQSAKGDSKPRTAGQGAVALWFIKTVIKARFNGEYKRTPFFKADGTPIVTPRVLSTEEHVTLMNAVRATPEISLEVDRPHR